MKTRWKTCLWYSSFTAAGFLFFYNLYYFHTFKRLLNHIKGYFNLQEGDARNQLKNKVKIYFGSQGGTAEGFARELKNDLQELFQINAEIINLEFFNKHEIEQPAIRVFIVATYGNGEPTDNAVEFFNWLKSLKNDNMYFKNTKYSIMGLGSKEYSHFNKIAKKLDAYLSNFQAEKISETIFGDDDDNIYHDFEVWKHKFFQNLPNALHVKPIPLKPIKEYATEIIKWTDIKDITLSVRFIELQEKSMQENWPVEISSSRWVAVIPNTIPLKINKYKFRFNTEVNAKFYFDHCTGRVLSNENILKSEKPSIYGNKVNHLVVDIGEMSYKTADTIYILPKNSKDIVSWWLSRLRINEEQNKFIFVNRGSHSDTHLDTDTDALKVNDNVPMVLSKDCTDECGRRMHPKRILENGLNDVNKNDGDSDSDTTVLAPFPTPCSIKYALEYYCDLTTIPRVNILKKFSCFLKDTEELKMFNYIMSNKKRSIFLNICNECFMTLPEFVSIYMTSAEFELSPFLQLIPKIAPRAYTISSSPKDSPHILSVTIKKKQYPIHSIKRALKKLKANDMLPNISIQHLRELCAKGRWFRGTASYYLTEELQINDKIMFTMKPSKFVLPTNMHSTHIIMIATGTGIAPFKGFLAEFKHYDQKVATTGKKKRTAKRILFFGCKWRKVDFLYEQDLLKAQSEAHIDETYFAFSRDQENKIYVQDLIRQQQQLVWSLLMKGAYIYVCGNTNMGKDVAATINAIAHLNKHPDKKFLKKLKKSGRYVEETW